LNTSHGLKGVDMTVEPALQLYAYWTSMAVYRVRVALNLRDIRAHEIEINLAAGEQYSYRHAHRRPL
jgi:glutathione S-transferase